jgi:S1-C subfamily serine protease
VLVLVGLAAICTVAALAFARTSAPIGSGVVVINTNLGYQSAAGAGTGMVLTSSGLVLTNNHVIAGATQVRVVVPGTGHRYSARVVGYAKSDDVALLQLQSAANLKTVSTGNASRLKLGTKVTALGNAGGTGRLTSVTGTVTGLGKSITASAGDGSNPERLTGLIETNANVQPGDSGGPLLDTGSHVVGMNTAVSENSPFAGNDADAYAIPITHALSIVRQIAAGKSSATVHIGGTAFLGVQVGSVPSDPYDYGSLPASGAYIASVVPNGPAASAGLAVGDVITAIDGRSVSGPATVSTIVLQKKPGATITVRYVDQSGAGYVTHVKLGSGPPQ